MALHKPTPVSHRYLTCHMTDVSDNTAPNGAAYVAVPWKGILKELHVTIHGAITGTDSVVTCSTVHNGTATAITGGTVTVTQASSAAGSTFVAIPTARTEVVEGDAIKFLSDGASSTTAAATCMAIIDIMGA